MENALQIQIVESHLKHFIDLENWGGKRSNIFLREAETCQNVNSIIS